MTSSNSDASSFLLHNWYDGKGSLDLLSSFFDHRGACFLCAESLDVYLARSNGLAMVEAFKGVSLHGITVTLVASPCSSIITIVNAHHYQNLTMLRSALLIAYAALAAASPAYLQAEGSQHKGIYSSLV